MDHFGEASSIKRACLVEVMHYLDVPLLCSALLCSALLGVTLSTASHGRPIQTRREETRPGVPTNKTENVLSRKEMEFRGPDLELA